jgi:enoyl-CoA hydratase
MTSPVLYSASGAIATVRLNRPEKRNALSSDMISRLSEVLGQIHDDPTIRAVILAGDDKAFCSGTDISELQSLDQEAAKLVSSKGQALCAQVEKFRCPVIAAVNGVAAGGGFELVLACHLRIAATDAQFSLPEVNLGAIPAYGGTQRLVREIGKARAFEIALAAETLTAEDARRMGLINKVVEPQNVFVEASLLAEQVAEFSPLSIRAVIEAVIEGSEMPLEQGLELESRLFADLFSKDDVREGTRAFLEKRKPVFTGT